MTLNTRKLFTGIICIFIMTVTFSVITSKVFGYSEQEAEVLRQKYSWGVILLTPTDLKDIHSLLTKKDAFINLINSGSSSGMNLLASFLLRIVQDTSIQYTNLMFELRNMQAGFVRGTANFGTIQPLAWGTDQVFNIVVWCDNYLGGLIKLRELEGKMESKDIEIGDVWAQVKKMKKNVYITEVKIAGLNKKLRNYIDLRKEDLDKLEKSDNETYIALENFRKSYDKVQFAERKSIGAKAYKVIAIDRGVEKLGPTYTGGEIIWLEPQNPSKLLMKPEDSQQNEQEGEL